ncbi:MAG: DNA circularization N-terminal domain-containing protein [Burkholderiales bacterium]|nr:DNA circularization N-terminal domain-containing protein [Burkholderiales bacterium]
MISPWRQQLQRAKFRDVAFFVRSTDGQVGRRTVLHEYPQRDDPYSEDMGRRAREFTIEAIIIGPDYFKVRDALIDAIETPGPGTLIHPYRGRMEVVLSQPARISESPEEGGLVRFSLTFVEAGKNQQPSARADTRTQVDQAAANATSAVAADFAKVFSVADKPEFVEASALAVARNVTAAITAVRSGMIPDLSVIAEYTAAAFGVSNALGSLIRSPADLASNIMGLVQGLRGLGRSPLAGFDALAGLFGYGSDLKPVPTTTVVRRAQAANQAALVILTRQTAAIEGARAAAQADYESYNQAITVRDKIADQLDSEAQIAPEAVYTALIDLRAATVRDITARGADLARISSITLPSTMPAVVAAYRIYGDATKEAELVTRNRIRHPGFVPGGAPLEVLAASKAFS